MFVTRCASFREEYPLIVQQVLIRGEYAEPRGLPTREVLSPVIIVEDPTDCLPLGVGRKLNPGIGAVEAWQLIGGFSEPDITCAVAPNMAQFREDAGYFHGAYGERVGWQYEHLLNKLRSDRDTRQAILTMWSPQRDLISPKRDLPCTIYLDFLIRNDKLLLTASMRSNDAWWGLAYDVFQFTQLQLTVARVLGIEAGEYRHHAISLHVYERDVPAIEEMLGTVPRDTNLRFHGIGNGGQRDMGAIMVRARSLLAQNAEESLKLTPTEEWYRQQILPAAIKVYGG